MDDNVDRLLEEGLALYGRGDEKGAIARWKRALELAPGEPRALDYLASAGVSAPAVPPPASAAPAPQPMAQVIELKPRRSPEESVWRKEVAELVRARRYEEALSALYRHRANQPENTEIPASIRTVKEQLVSGYAQKLGGLDRVPSRDRARRAANPEELSVLRYVDGISSYDDIASASPIGRFRTLGVLVRLFADSGYLAPPSLPAKRPSVPVATPAIPPPPPAVRATPVPPAVRATPVPPAVHATPAPPPVQPPPAVQATPPSVAKPPASAVAPVAAEPASSKRPASSGPSPFDVLFEQATRASLARRFEEAEALFLRCQELKPGDSRVRVSLERIQARRGT